MAPLKPDGSGFKCTSCGLVLEAQNAPENPIEKILPQVPGASPQPRRAGTIVLRILFAIVLIALGVAIGGALVWYDQIDPCAGSQALCNLVKPGS